MTIAPMWETCPKCHKKYSRNPDVGNFHCPHCYGLGESNGGFLGNMMNAMNSLFETVSKELDDTKNEE